MTKRTPHGLMYRGQRDQLRDALRRVLNTLSTERSDQAWAAMSPEEKAMRYDAAVQNAKDVLELCGG